MNTATISFLPVCSECHQVIWRTVDCIRDDMEIRETLKDEMERKILLPHYTVVPERCPNCGSIFTAISVPTKLPFDNNMRIRSI